MEVFKVLSILALIGLVCAAPLEPLEERVETDHELTAGYFQGDMILDMEMRNGMASKEKRWPNNTVFYKIYPGFFDKAHIEYILLGMQIIENASCIKFKEATAENKYYVNITGFDDGCYSSVGWTGRVQNYNLANDPLDKSCFRLGTVVHEFLHTLGFHHMQSASNRDDYVYIAEENIKPNTINNFKKYDSTYVDDFDEEYDYGSVLHYSAYAFSKNGEMTIVPLKEEAADIMGQRRGMSKSDIHKLNTMYKCPVTV